MRSSFCQPRDVLRLLLVTVATTSTMACSETEDCVRSEDCGECGFCSSHTCLELSGEQCAALLPTPAEIPSDAFHARRAHAQIDGVFDEWDDVERLDFEEKNDLAKLGAFLKVLWDDDGLYLAVFVTDDVVMSLVPPDPSPSAYYGDRVAFTLDLGPATSRLVRRDEWETTVVATLSGFLVDVNLLWGGTVKGVIRDDGWALEVALRWPGGLRPVAGNAIGLDVSVFDEDTQADVRTDVPDGQIRLYNRFSADTANVGWLVLESGE